MLCRGAGVKVKKEKERTRKSRNGKVFRHSDTRTYLDHLLDTRVLIRTDFGGNPGYSSEVDGNSDNTMDSFKYWTPNR